jgi:galactonate dehydratase
MKIVKAEIFLVESGGLRPVLLQLTAEDGTRGVGEAAVAYGTGAQGAAALLEEMAARYLAGGVSAFRSEAVWNEIYDHSFWAKGGGPLVSAAMSAIETAMLDLKARALGVPVYELLGGRVQDRLRAYCNGWYFGALREADLPAAAERAVADGYDALKFYPFVEILADGRLRHPSLRAAADSSIVRRAIRRVAEIRRAVGPEVELMLDLSSGLAADDTIHFCNAVAEHELSFIEEPTVPGDTALLARIAAAIPQRVAVGERLYSRYAFRDVLEARAADILQPDIGNTGGLAEARRIAAMAEAYSLKVQPHVCASAVSTAAAMHLSAALPNFCIQEHFPYWARIPGHVEIAADPVEEAVAGGVIPIDDRPGLGVALRDAAVAPWRRAELSLI